MQKNQLKYYACQRKEKERERKSKDFLVVGYKLVCIVKGARNNDILFSKALNEKKRSQDGSRIRLTRK